MAIPEINFSQTDFSQIMDADAQLQEELRGMFAVDTQTYLHRYHEIVQQLQATGWHADIQELYRCIHTIKGGAVTIGADAVLKLATVLEDVLSDLRYLELAPPLNDGYLRQILLECSELLTASLELQQAAETLPFLDRLQQLHQAVRERYLPQWNLAKQIQQEFAAQGFDLLVLELEIALERLPQQGAVPEPTVQTARDILGQLHQLGQELELASGWTTLLEQAQILFDDAVNSIWRSQWPRLFQALKTCAKQGGEPIAFEFEACETVDFESSESSNFESAALDFMNLESENLRFTHLAAEPQVDTLEANQLTSGNSASGNSTSGNSAVDDLKINDLEIDDLEIGKVESSKLEIDHLANLDLGTGAFLNSLSFLDALPDSLADITASIAFTDWLDTLSPLTEIALPEAAETAIPSHAKAAFSPELAAELVSVELATAELAAVPKAPERTSALTAQVPVGLDKLDQSAQALTETLLALQTTQGFYQTLQTQIAQMVSLAQENTQQITQLRQIQDDYALLDQLRDQSMSKLQTPTLERYRQGYSTINRLLENSLRLSEMGAETDKTAQQMTAALQRIDQMTAQLQTTIEDSRLIPFRNLSFRARAILRDLTTRYGKSAQLVVQGEQTELDVSIARQLEPALLHLIRNAYDHGLELPSDRLAQGKPEQGTLTISLQRQGNWFQFQVQDDGRGIDASAVQARAEALGLPLTTTQTAASLLQVLCQPGFSSQTQVSEISGRGMGMDVVAAQIDRLNGQLTLQTLPGAGTTFELKFPVPRLLVPCVLLQAGDEIFAIPQDDIRTMTLFDRLSATPDDAIPGSWIVNDAEGSTPILDLHQYWQLRHHHRPIDETAVCLAIAGTDAQPDVWLLADALLAHTDLIIKPIPLPLRAAHGLIGVSLQANGSLIPVLEARPLVQQLLSVSSQLVEPPIAADPAELVADMEPLIPLILIVDDAALMRRRLESSLTTSGYLTQTCQDGQDAWNWLQTHPQPSLIITDIEMPNLDGFTLVDRCRQAGISVPILVISSRLSEEWFDEAKRLGANDYLTKGFSTVELMNKIAVLLKL